MGDRLKRRAKEATEKIKRGIVFPAKKRRREKNISVNQVKLTELL